MDEDRRSGIIRLLETRDDHLPQPVRRAEGSAGFVNESRDRTCPDCLANGRVMFGCETCGGSGTVSPARIDRVASVDELPDDGETRDPYASTKVVPFGFDQTRHDAAHDRERQITMLGQQTRPPRSEAQLLEEANRRGFAWEEERRAMYQRFDYAALDQALDTLRARDDSAYHGLHSVYVYGWMAELSPAAEVAVERGLVFLDEQLPDPLRAPGLPNHPAADRQSQRRAA